MQLIACTNSMTASNFSRWEFFQVGNKFYKDMDRLEALKIGLTTWSKWIDSNIDPRKTTVFFQGISASHFK